MTLTFHHIIPTNYMRAPTAKLATNERDKIRNPGDLLLAHLVESDPEYRRIYGVEQGEFYTPVQGRILDNSAFELYRAGLPMFDGNKMIELGKVVGAEYLVLPDYPAQSPMNTIDAAGEFAPQFKDAGFKSFFVPQGRIGNFEDYAFAFMFAAQSPLIDYIGVSIIAGPNVFGVDKPGSIQTFLARLTLCQMLEERGLISLAKNNGKKIHFLGMTDGPKEILFASMYDIPIDSWDSSAAAWAGINDIAFDNSPTGLIDGKVRSHVNFNLEFDKQKIPLIRSNMAVIDQYVDTYNAVRGD